MDNSPTPEYGVIIDRLKQVAKVQSDAGLSKWLGKPDSFIAVCRNRQGINIDVIVPKLNDLELLFVLRGRAPQISDEAPAVPGSKIAVAIDAIGRPLDDVATDLEVQPKTIRAWIQGKEKPTTAQFAKLFIELAKAAAGGCRRLQGDLHPHSRPSPADEESRHQLTGT
jgi:hypothetical protein